MAILSHDAARSVATKTVGSPSCGVHGMRKARRRAGESSRCEDPAPTVGIGGEIVAGYAAPTIICAHGRINGNGEWEDNDAAL